MSRFHQYHTASLGESWLAAAAFTIHQFQQVIAQDLISKHIRQANDGLFYGSDTFHDFSALLKQRPEFVLGRAQNFLHVGAAGQVAIFAVTTNSIHDYPSRAEPSTLPQHWLTRIGTKTSAHLIPQNSQRLSCCYFGNLALDAAFLNA
jgi:hypothetical protein